MFQSEGEQMHEILLICSHLLKNDFSYTADTFCVNTFDFNQKQLPEVFFKGLLKNLAILTGKHLHQSLFFNKVAGEAIFTELLRATTTV